MTPGLSVSPLINAFQQSDTVAFIVFREAISVCVVSHLHTVWSRLRRQPSSTHCPGAVFPRDVRVTRAEQVFEKSLVSRTDCSGTVYVQDNPVPNKTLTSQCLTS